MKKQLITYAFAFILCTSLITSGCGAGANTSAAYDTAPESAEVQSEETYDASEDQGELYGNFMENGSDASADLYQTDTAAAASASGADASPADISGSMDDSDNKAAGNTDAAENESASHSTMEKLIYTYHYSAETKEFESFTKKISEKTEQLGGYIESSETSGSASDRINRNAEITLRIPADQMHQMLSLIDSESNVTYSSSGVENITLQYVDMQSHVKALRTEQETLLKLIEKADKLDDIIALQSQLTQVRYEIESYESRLRTYDNLVDYSTLHLSVQEVERTTTMPPAKASFVEEVKNQFSDNLYAVGQWLRSFVIWLIGSLPILVPVVLAAVLILILIRKWNKRRQKRTAAHNSSIPGGYQSIYQNRQDTDHDMDTNKTHASNQNPAVSESNTQNFKTQTPDPKQQNFKPQTQDSKQQDSLSQSPDPKQQDSLSQSPDPKQQDSLS